VHVHQDEVWPEPRGRLDCSFARGRLTHELELDHRAKHCARCLSERQLVVGDEYADTSC